MSVYHRAENTTFEKGSGDLTKLDSTGWNLLAEDVSFPIAVLDNKALQTNAKWMQSFCDRSEVKLAPHGKTTMTPELFQLQLEQGCWGLSLATVPQVVNAYHLGVKRIILANQLIGQFHFQQLANLLADDDFEFYCFVDSVDNIRALGRFFSEQKLSLNLLIEIGVPNGRCGWRDQANITQLMAEIARYPGLRFAGLSFYEGVIHDLEAEQQVTDFVESIVKTFESALQQVKPQTDELIITGAGSAWYDLVAEVLANYANSLNFTPVLRPGCYLIHDTGIYQDAQQQVLERSQLACDISGELVSSLTVWAYVHSVPEPGLAIIGLGKRDVAFDAGLPMPQLHFRPGMERPQLTPQSWQALKVMDQHCMMKIAATDDIKPGDLISFSTSHPCLTFDKWRRIAIVDENFVVTKQVETLF